MGFINLMIESEAHACIKNNQLFLKNIDKQESFPLEDLNSILLESLQTNISTYTLSKLADNGVIVYICDDKHLPNGYLLPFHSHYNQLKMYQAQTSVSAPFQKQLWKAIVQAKIRNQSTCLELIGKESHLNELIEKVQSDDRTNVEAIAASKYFKIYLDGQFSRQADTNVNTALNYGYAIIRGIVARNIVSHGLLPFLGLKHANQYNNFNLADDLIEVFRPFVDLCVYKNRDLVFGRVFKHILCQLPNCDCMIAGKRQTISYAIEIYIQSFAKSLTEKVNYLQFPYLIPLALHQYE